jgi:hypothetical protein
MCQNWFCIGSYSQQPGWSSSSSIKSTIESLYISSKRSKWCVDLWWLVRIRSRSVVEKPWETNKVFNLYSLYTYTVPSATTKRRYAVPKLFPRHSTWFSTERALTDRICLVLLLGLPNTKGRIHTQIAFHKSLIAFQSSPLFFCSCTFGKSLSQGLSSSIINHLTLTHINTKPTP